MEERANLIGGAWCEGKERFANISPSDTSDVIGHYAQADAADVESAIVAAAQAFPEWAATTPQQRADVLETAGLELSARREELGTALAREEGKTRAQGMGEVARTAQIFKFFAQEALRLAGETHASIRPGVSIEVLREPIGPVGVITPWNFPISLPGWKIAGALAYGNTVVFKPAQLVPESAWALTDILHRAGLPAGVMNLVMGRGSVIGPLMGRSTKLAGITFTGSTATGFGLAREVIEHGGKIQLELGGKNPLVVMEDADLDAAVEIAVDGAFFLTGQRCTASSRLIVHERIHDAFVEALVKRMETLKVGHALKEGTQIGPVADAGQLEKNESYIRLGQEEGAELATGGARLERATEGHFFSPALFVGSTNDMRINREEIFGPIAGVIRAGDFDEALALANDTDYGLSAGIVTQSLAYAEAFKRRVRAGMVMVNLATAGVDYHVPFGGMKASSYGPKEQGQHAREFFTQVRTAYTKA